MPADTVRTAFRDVFGAEPAGVWSAPGRVNLIGEHTDYNDGLCLPIALPQRTYVAARRTSTRRLRLRSAQADDTVEVLLDDVAPGHPKGWAAYAAGVVWALEQHGSEVGGLDVAVDGEVPLGAGLSSSAALECAVAVAASDLFGLGLTSDDEALTTLAQRCRQAENDIAQAPTGGLDQSASLRCRQGHALMLDCRDGSVEHVPFDLPGHDLALLVMDTRAEHSLVDGQYAERRESCERAADLLGVASLREVDPAALDAALDRLGDERLRKRARHVVTEIERVRQVVGLLDEQDFQGVGKVFDVSHASMRDDFEISCAELDVAVESSRAAGAWGARMTGGGFGGSAIALVRRQDVATVIQSVESAFADNGFRPPHCFPVEAGPPAARDR